MMCLQDNQLQKNPGWIFANNTHCIESDNAQYVTPEMLQGLFVHENESRFTPGKKEKCN